MLNNEQDIKRRLIMAVILTLVEQALLDEKGEMSEETLQKFFAETERMKQEMFKDLERFTLRQMAEAESLKQESFKKLNAMMREAIMQNLKEVFR